MTKEEIRKALDTPDKASRKAFAKQALEIEADDPERYKTILAKTDWEGEAMQTYRSYRRAAVFQRIAMVLAVLVVIGSYLVGDFGMRFLTGWAGRYALAVGIVVAMGIFAGGALLVNSQKERLVAFGILEGL
ncbi:MAG: hypothetical protein IKM59_03665 [Oscillospiraceae bacterium]|nr:hypothetical protein [Oscillospiraceae bacterium]